LIAADVDYWVAGGWGVDALLGEQTRTHHDLDLVIAAAPVLWQRRQSDDAKRALEALGYRFERNDIHLGAWFVERIVLCHSSGRRVELLPIDERPADFFATGLIGGRATPCLSPDTQLRIHTGYRRTSADDHDVDALCDRLGLEAPPSDRKMEPGWR
jgi:lincosamide nucleotidyltransferase A/C/D/E